jgi:hypothetical protein
MWSESSEKDNATDVVEASPVDHLEYNAGDGNDEGLPSYDPAETQKVLRKIDWRLLPTLALLYLLAFLDRGNLGNAKVAGMADDLHLTGTQYNLAATVLCPPWLLGPLYAHSFLTVCDRCFSFLMPSSKSRATLCLKCFDPPVGWRVW